MIPNAKGFSVQQGRLFRRIPLGILIAYHNHLSAAGCELLLHYVVTGIIDQKFSGIQNSVFDGEIKGKMSFKRIVFDVAGCRIVFDVRCNCNYFLFFFETEEEEVDFVCQVKLKTGDYLFKCMKRLLQLLQLNSMEMVC